MSLHIFNYLLHIFCVYDLNLNTYNLFFNIHDIYWILIGNSLDLIEFIVEYSPNEESRPFHKTKTCILKNHTKYKDTDHNKLNDRFCKRSAKKGN